MPVSSCEYKLSLWSQDSALEEGGVNMLPGNNGSLLVVSGDHVIEIKLVEVKVII